VHKLWCDSLHHFETFPQVDLVFRFPTEEEMRLYRGEKKKATNRMVPTANNVVYDDVSDADDERPNDRDTTTDYHVALPTSTPPVTIFVNESSLGPINLVTNIYASHDNQINYATNSIMICESDDDQPYHEPVLALVRKNRAPPPSPLFN